MKKITAIILLSSSLFTTIKPTKKPSCLKDYTIRFTGSATFAGLAYMLHQGANAAYPNREILAMHKGIAEPFIVPGILNGGAVMCGAISLAILFGPSDIKK